MQLSKNTQKKSNKCLVVSRTSPFVKSGSGFVTKQFMSFFSEDEMIFLSEKNNQITETYSSYPPTVKYDCTVNFAPVTIFNINDMKELI